MRNKFYAGNLPGGEGLTWVGENPPENKDKFSTWFNTATGKTYTWYQSTNHGQWIQETALID